MKTRGMILLVVCALSLVVRTTVLKAREPLEDQKTPELEKQLQQLLDQRVITAERARDALMAAFEAQTVTLFDFVDTANKLKDARLAAAKTPAQRLDALEKHMDLMRSAEQKIKVLYDIGTRGGEAKEYATVQRERQSAEIDYIRAILKQRQ